MSLFTAAWISLQGTVTPLVAAIEGLEFRIVSPHLEEALDVLCSTEATEAHLGHLRCLTERWVRGCGVSSIVRRETTHEAPEGEREAEDEAPTGEITIELHSPIVYRPPIELHNRPVFYHRIMRAGPHPPDLVETPAPLRAAAVTTGLS